MIVTIKSPEETMNKHNFSIHTLTFLFLWVFTPSSVFSQNIPNPVLPGVADAGVLKYNGKYYIGGVFTDGGFYESEDLVNWTGPVHVFDMDNEWTAGTGAGNDQIHANDMIYLNGTFHLYWSVNYWGKDKHIVHIGHAESDNVLGPYTEPVKDRWMDNRIDPHIFQDDNGRLYMYMVRFTDGNTIWARPMKDPRTFSGHPVCQFSSLPNTWETMDNRVAEGPWVIKYRNRYYMMYNANHTGTEWGNYQLGVAEANSPTTFNNGGKYPYPLLLSNQTILEEKYADILRTFNDSSWTFTVNKSTTGNLALRVNHNGDTRIYLNGKLIYDKTGPDYIIHNLSAEDREALNDGENVLTIESKKEQRNHLNVSLFDTKNEKADDILFSPGQPNIVRGPNGFEWWLVYMGNKNRERRSQYINRIHFHNKTMHADGMTAGNTPGYFPEPTKPTASRIEEFALAPGKEWLVEGNNPPATTYLIEANIKTNTNAGVIAWWKDKTNWIKISLDNDVRKWSVIQCINNQININSYPLYPDFKAGVYHKIAIERNGRNFAVRIDGLRAPGMPLIQTAIDNPGIPGVFSGTDEASFAGIIYTNGWDEFDNNITSWGNALSGTPIQGNYTTDGRYGIRNFNLNLHIFKGDLLPKYEFTVQVTNESSSGKTGAYPVYIDENNYIKTLFNFDTQTLSVTSVRSGRILSFEEYSLQDWKAHYADIKYTDFMEKGYTFNTPTWINGIQLNRLAHGEKNVFIDNMFDKLTAEYYADEEWHPVPVDRIEVASNPMYNEAVFTHPVKAEALRFINKDPQDQRHYIYKIRVNEVFKQSYNLRCVKLNDKLLIFVDGKQIATIDAWDTPAQVGLLTEESISTFNGIMRYHIP